jgi:hypothetical protein
MRLVGLQEGDVLPEMQTPPPPPPPIEQNGLPNWVSLLQSILFWLLLIGIVLYALVMYIRQNQQLMTIFRRVPGWRLLLQAVRWLRDRLRGAGRTVGDLVKTTRQRLSEIIRRAREGSPGMPALRLGRLDARQQVRFYYLALLRRSAESGRPRRPDETPAEYGAALAALLAENEESPAVHRAASGAEAGETAAQPMVATMTDTFIEARYTTHPIDADQVHLVRRAWDQLRRIFRDLARKKQ